MAINPKIQYDFVSVSIKSETWKKVIDLSYVLTGQKRRRVTASEAIEDLLVNWDQSQEAS